MNGWECPKCGAVMSPYHPVCWYCRPNQGGYTSGNAYSLCTCKTSNAICPAHGVLGLGKGEGAV